MERIGLFLFSMGMAGLLAAQEVCDNGTDDDADGLIDLNDTNDCACGVAAVLLDGILPNPSFEDHDCVPTTFSQLDCAMYWSQGTGSTADYFRTDGYMPTFITQPLPNGGSGCIGGYFCPDYMEYAGTCLLQPLLAGSAYTIDLSIAAFEVDNFLNSTTALDLSPVNVTIYGYSSCPPMPTNISLCPGTEGWTELGYATYTPSSIWSGISISFTTTFDVEAIMIGSPCLLPPDYPHLFDPWLAYFLMDELSISSTGTTGAPLTSTGSWCAGDLVVTAHPDSVMNSCQWYQDGIAIPGATDSVLAISALALDSGDYVFSAIGDTSCTLSTFHVDAEIDPLPYIALTVDGLWCPLPGTYQWFQNGVPIPEATGDHYLPGESGVYTVELTNGQGCSTLSYPFDWVSSVIAPLVRKGPSLLFSPIDATLLVRGAEGRSVLTVSDVSGRGIIHETFTGPDHRCQLTGYPPGVYVARMDGQWLRFVR